MQLLLNTLCNNYHLIANRRREHNAQIIRSMLLLHCIIIDGDLSLCSTVITLSHHFNLRNQRQAPCSAPSFLHPLLPGEVFLPVQLLSSIQISFYLITIISWGRGAWPSSNYSQLPSLLRIQNLSSIFWDPTHFARYPVSKHPASFARVTLAECFSHHDFLQGAPQAIQSQLPD